MALTLRALALAGALAGITMLAVPAAAGPAIAAPAAGTAAIPAAFDHASFDPAANGAYWRCWGRRCGWRPYYGRRHDHVDAGDVLIGAAIIGGLAAIISAENRRERERERDVVIVERDWREDARRYDDRRAAPRGSGASGLDNAVDLCLARIARDARVDSVDTVTRTGAGWRVGGALFNGAPFTCRIGNDGRIEGVDYGDGAASSVPRGDGQWSDDRYSAARLAMAGPAQPEAPVALPAYPGGPIAGEVIPDAPPSAIDDDL